MASQIIVILAVVVFLLSAIYIWGKVGKFNKPVMKESCHGNCAECASACKEKDEPKGKFDKYEEFRKQ